MQRYENISDFCTLTLIFLEETTDFTDYADEANKSTLMLFRHESASGVQEQVSGMCQILNF